MTNVAITHPVSTISASGAAQQGISQPAATDVVTMRQRIEVSSAK